MKLEKLTQSTPVSSLSRPRRYLDACATAHAMDLIGDRWALFVIRELMFGPRRFTDLRASLPGISANVLTQRLGELEATGILVRTRLPPPAAVQVYGLTPWGYATEPVFEALGRWGAQSPLHDVTLPFSACSLMLSLRTMLSPERAAGLSMRIGFSIAGEEFAASLAGGTITIARGAADGADLRFATDDAATLVAFFYGGVPLARLEADGALVIGGDRALAERLPALFPLPPKAG